MTAEASVQVACVGFVFDPLAQAEIRAAAPPEIVLSFAESLEEMSEAMYAESDVWVVAAPVTDEMLARAPRLRFIQKWGVGYDKIDVAAAERRGIPVAITAGANAITIAEHTVALMLAVMRRIADSDRAIRAGKWSPRSLRPYMRGLYGKTIGIVGFGNIGKAVARLLTGFDVEVIYNKRSGTHPDGNALGATYADMPELLAASDLVTLHCPAEPANTSMFGRAQFTAMKPGAVFINTSRGNLVVEAALVDALRSGHLLGAGLDVFAEEPLPASSPLASLESVVMTPHVAGGILDGVAPMARHAFGNILRTMNGEPLDPADVVVAAGKPVEVR